MVRRFFTKREIRDGLKEFNDEIAKAFFKGETHADMENTEIKNTISFDDCTVYVHYELSVGYKRPVFKV